MIDLKAANVPSAIDNALTLVRERADRRGIQPTEAQKLADGLRADVRRRRRALPS